MPPKLLRKSATVAEQEGVFSHGSMRLLAWDDGLPLWAASEGLGTV